MFCKKSFMKKKKNLTVANTVSNSQFLDVYCYYYYYAVMIVIFFLRMMMC